MMRRWFWQSIHSFWRKFCGVSDEYKTLRSRWTAISHEFQKELPPLWDSKIQKTTFSLLDNLLNSLNGWFENIALLRNTKEDYKKTISRLSIDYDKLETVNQAFFDLCTYTGLIKHAYFQRTVSLEIPQVESAIPHSPERTIGNEMFYSVADSIAKAYCNCIDSPYATWDGFITFMPTIGEEGFYGAFFRPSRLLKLYHISMSEEQKYFLGTYLTLAHEFGHAAIVGKNRNLDLPRWFRLLYVYALARVKNYVEKDEKCRHCKKCQVHAVKYENEFYFRTFEDFVADLFALRIGGVNTIHTLLDFAPAVAMSIVRSQGVLRYMMDRSFQKSCFRSLDERIKSTRRQLIKKLPHSIESQECLQCWLEIGNLFGTSVKRLFNILDIDPIQNIVLEEFDHNYTSINKGEIEKALATGKAIPEVDPRVILSVYNDLITNNKGPNFSATTYSLVYNESL